MNEPGLYMILLGCRPPGRLTEQHDIFLGIAADLKSLIPDMVKHWPEVKGKIHIDAWQQVQHANGYKIGIQARGELFDEERQVQLFFINLGGYKPGDFEEYHYKMVVAAKDSAEAVKLAKQTAFFQHTGYAGAVAHIDDKYGIDVDDVYRIVDILPPHIRERYHITLVRDSNTLPDELHIGYLSLDRI